MEGRGGRSGEGRGVEKEEEEKEKKGRKLVSNCSLNSLSKSIKHNNVFVCINFASAYSITKIKKRITLFLGNYSFCINSTLGCYCCYTLCEN